MAAITFSRNVIKWQQQQQKVSAGNFLLHLSKFENNASGYKLLGSSSLVVNLGCIHKSNIPDRLYFISKLI
jgi:hypothetical protein